MEIMVQYFAKMRDREMDDLIKKAFHQVGFNLAGTVQDPHGSVDFTFENKKISAPKDDTRVACIKCMEPSVRDRLDSTGLCLSCQVIPVKNSVEPEQKEEEERIHKGGGEREDHKKQNLDFDRDRANKILSALGQLPVGEQASMHITDEKNGEVSENSFRKIGKVIVKEATVIEKEEPETNDDDEVSPRDRTVDL